MPPMPPLALRLRVSGVADEAHFDELGRHSIVDLTRALAVTGRKFASFARVLDWGAGCGRVVRHMPIEPGQQVFACDIDAEAIAWLQQAMPTVQASVCAGLPPLPFADGAFDLITNHSVMSHLDEAYQDAWLAELGRVLAPDGLLLLTAHGAFGQDFWAHFLPKDDPATPARINDMYRAIDLHGLHHIIDKSWSADFPDFYQNTLHAPWYIFEHWTRFFEIAAYIPRGSLSLQDMIVLRHKRNDIPERTLPLQARRIPAGG